MPVAAGELEGQLVDRVEMAKAGGAADEERSIAGAEHGAGGRRVAAAGQDRHRAGRGDVALEGARPRRRQHRLE